MVSVKRASIIVRILTEDVLNGQLLRLRWLLCQITSYVGLVAGHWTVLTVHV